MSRKSSYLRGDTCNENDGIENEGNCKKTRLHECPVAQHFGYQSIPLNPDQLDLNGIEIRIPK